MNLKRYIQFICNILLNISSSELFKIYICTCNILIEVSIFHKYIFNHFISIKKCNFF
jgi:hypothetical protein